MFSQPKNKAYPHNALNSSKSAVRIPGLSLCTLDEIKSNLHKRGVTDAKWISIKKNDQILANTYILNFNTPKPPAKIETYIPKPLRCHNY